MIDGTEHFDEKSLHYYLKKIRVKKSDYYEQYYPRVDKQTGEKIPFKEYESYFKTDFLNRNNLKAFCKEQPKEAVELGKEFLLRRAKEKNFYKAFSNVELRSVFCPPVHFFQKNGGYNEICLNLGLEPVFRYKDEIEFQFQSLKNGLIRCDTREQKLIPFKTIKTKIDTIGYGDYAIEEPYNTGIFVEKKSIGDFAHSFGRDIDRLRREIERCKKAGDYMVVLVQCSLLKSLNFDYLWEMRHSKVSPGYVFGNVRDLLHEFDNLQFLFIEEKKSEQVILDVFRMGKFVKTTDLQYAYDLKLI